MDGMNIFPKDLTLFIIEFSFPKWKCKLNINNICINMNSHVAAIEYLLEHVEEINWSIFSRNPNDIVIEYMLRPENVSKIYWDSFTMNSSEAAVEYLLKNTDKIKWIHFSRNSSNIAIEYMLRPENVGKIDWDQFSENFNDKAVEYLL